MSLLSSSPSLWLTQLCIIFSLISDAWVNLRSGLEIIRLKTSASVQPAQYQQRINKEGIKSQVFNSLLFVLGWEVCWGFWTVWSGHGLGWWSPSCLLLDEKTLVPGPPTRKSIRKRKCGRVSGHQLCLLYPWRDRTSPPRRETSLPSTSSTVILVPNEKE